MERRPAKLVVGGANVVFALPGHQGAFISRAVKDTKALHYAVGCLPIIGSRRKG